MLPRCEGPQVQHGVPFEFVRLECDGQVKLLVKAGRVILLPESITALNEPPQASDYKVALASVHGLISQLELALNDEHQRRIRDWSGCVLGAILHGASGPEFTRQHRALGSLMLGVTDDVYSQWMLRLDLHRVAMWGRDAIPEPVTPAQRPEPDEVSLTMLL